MITLEKIGAEAAKNLWVKIRRVWGKPACGHRLLNLEPAIAGFPFNRSWLAARALTPSFGISAPRDWGDQAQRHPARRQSQGAVEQEPWLRAGSHRSQARCGGVTRKIQSGRVLGYQDDGF